MTPQSNTRSITSYWVLSVKGFCMGASDVIPGVSGGTMAFILGIYEELIGAVRSFDVTGLRLLVRLRFQALLDHVAWRFLLAVGIGILAAVLSLSRVLEWLLLNQPVFIWSFFFGLILASAATVSRRVERWSAGRWFALACGTVGTYFLVGIVPLSTTQAPWFLFLSGAIAVCAMILPGISGSFILVLLGKYQFVLQALNQRDLMALSLVAAGACVGLILFSRVLGWLLARYHDLMVAVLTGLMVGSLRKVWPWKETADQTVDLSGTASTLYQSNTLPQIWSHETTAALSLMAGGVIVVLLLDLVGRRTRMPTD
jgi:putative membrane protein